MSETRSRLRQMLNGPEMIVAPFVYDCLQAKLARREGFKAVYMTGFGTAAARGFPDLGLLTMHEMIDNVRALARAVDIPLICDADTGYGEVINVQRTVREYEDAGAAALHIEDQAWPKRCGFLEGKQVIASEQMQAKVRAAVDARRDPELVIIARTDALAPLGWEEVTRRARAYRDAGADLIFVDGIKTLDDLRNCARLLAGLPLLYNGQLLHPREIAGYGFKLMIHIASLFSIYQRTRDAIVELAHTGMIAGAPGFELLPEITELLGAPDIIAAGRKYET
ncbi:MAG TPA: isocitrate lyase/PEP mutase family protein [Candidatus Binataceae bacterium]|nr:isocitrate lyase/PEP mutase family protein [Candidatus Binataceae bacterium]